MQKPGLLSLTVATIAGAWFFTAITLYFCFLALGTSLNFGLVLTGFFIGRTAGVISFLPGGLGTQDASMVGFYTLFGIPLAQGVLVAILFRVIYYFIPFALSLAFYRSLLRDLPKAGR